MGPITLFDKSFLQAISLDEAVWFDRFFLPVVCPVFYVETLGDLGKESSRLGAAENAVMKDVAQKFPEMDHFIAPNICSSQNWPSVVDFSTRDGGLLRVRIIKTASAFVIAEPRPCA
jgi:hypothetical protein